MKNTGALLVLLIGAAGAAFAGVHLAPEVDSGTGATALALLGGAVIVFLARVKR